MKAMVMQVRREFWEHRVLLIAPAALCAIYLALCVLVATGFNFGIELHGPNALAGRPSPLFYWLRSILFTTLLYALMTIVAFFYLCDSLYAERKDRSILFWKSLPVSDAMTVLSKLFVALIGLPLVVYALALVTNSLAWLVFEAAAGVGPPRNVSEHWTVLSWLELNGVLLADVFVLALWFAPVAAYQLLVSVWAPRAVFVWTLLPPAALILGQNIFLGSWSIAQLIGQRLGGVVVSLNASQGEGAAAIRAINAIPLLGRADLWIGVAIAAVLVFVTIRIRRHSDDT